MAEPIQIDGKWWHQAEDGTWSVWDPATARWTPSQAPPPQAQPPQAAPPPPPPAQITPERGPASSATGPPQPSAQPDAAPASTTTGPPQSSTESSTHSGTGTGAPSGRSVSASRDFVATGGGRTFSPTPLAIAAVVVVVAVVAAASLFFLTGDDEDPEPAAAAPVSTPEPSGPISPQGERNIYSVGRRVNECFGPETLVWAGDPRAGGLDRAGLKDDIRRISRNVEDIRGHRFRGPVDAKLVPRARVGKLAAKIAAAEIDPAEAKIDAQILIELGVLPRGTDLGKLQDEVVSDGIAGFYLPDDKRLYAGVGAQGFVPFDELVLAHELDHALLDATVGLPPLVPEDPSDHDRALASRAAVEGDATLTMFHYAVVSFDPSEWEALVNDPATAGGLRVQKIPYVLRRTLSFPYAEGLLFTCDLFSRGGWPEVDRSLRTPPTSTDQILFPDRYLRQTEAVDPPDPSAPSGWEQVRATSFGATDLLWLIQAAEGPDPENPQAGVQKVRGWAGGELHAWRKGGDLALQIVLVDGGVEVNSKGKGKAKGKGEAKNKGKDEAKTTVRYTLCRSLRSWYENEFERARSVSDKTTKVWRNGDTFAASSCAEKTPRLAIAPDRATAEALVTAD